MKNDALQAVVDMYGISESSHHTVLRSGERAALQGIQGNDLDALFADVRQLVAVDRNTPIMNTGVPSLLDERWAGVEGLKRYANAELSPEMVLSGMDPQRLKGEPHAIPRRAGRLAFARALSRELDSENVRPAPAIHALLSPGAIAKADARLQIIQALTSAQSSSEQYRFARFPEVMRRYKMNAGHIAKLAMCELDPQWVVASWRRREQHDVLQAARTIVNGRTIARGIVRASTVQRKLQNQ